MQDERTNKQPTRQTLKIELLSQWKLEAESRNLRPFSLENSEDDRPKMFCTAGKIRYDCVAITIPIIRPCF